MPKFHVSMPDDTLEKIMLRAEHDNRSGAINYLCQSHIELMDALKLQLAVKFDSSECGLIIDALNGVFLRDAFNIRMIPAGIEDAIKFDRLDTKWKCDGAALMEKLNATTLGERYAIADAIKLWWSGEYSKADADYSKLFSTE